MYVYICVLLYLVICCCFLQTSTGVLQVIYKTEPETLRPAVVPLNGIKPVSPEQEELIHRLVYFQNEYEYPAEEDLRRIVSKVFTADFMDLC